MRRKIVNTMYNNTFFVLLVLPIKCMSVFVVVFVVLFCYEGCSGLVFHVMKESESNSKTQNKLEFNFRPNTWQKRTNCARAKCRI